MVKNLPTKKVQCDEIWSFVYAKQRNLPEDRAGGDVWTWVGLDVDSKLVISWLVGGRDEECAHIFMHDLKSRLPNKIHLATDGLLAYTEAVKDAFGSSVDYGQLVKFEIKKQDGTGKQKRKSIIRKVAVEGNPEPKEICTAGIERQNLTMRMCMRRFTRLTNAFSKKVENHCYALALYFVFYNFCRIHQSLRITPAMECGLVKDVLTIEQLIEAAEHFSN